MNVHMCMCAPSSVRVCLYARVRALAFVGGLGRDSGLADGRAGGADAWVWGRKNAQEG